MQKFRQVKSHSIAQKIRTSVRIRIEFIWNEFKLQINNLNK